MHWPRPSCWLWRALRLVHPLVRTVIYSDIPVARRAHAHARAASLLGADEPSARWPWAPPSLP